jgi:hypothetical protein
VRKQDFPTLDVYFPTLRAGLWLVTCDGPYVRGAGGYQANLIVYARPHGRKVTARLPVARARLHDTLL